MVEWHGVGAAVVGMDQGFGGEEMRVHNVADVGVVEEVVAFAELEVELPIRGDGGGGDDTVGEAAVVVLADDAGGADGGGEEGVVVFWAAVGGEDERFGAGFGFGVVLDWVGDHEGVVFVCVDEVGH